MKKPEKKTYQTREGRIKINIGICIFFVTVSIMNTLVDNDPSITNFFTSSLSYLYLPILTLILTNLLFIVSELDFQQRMFDYYDNRVIQEALEITSTSHELIDEYHSALSLSISRGLKTVIDSLTISSKNKRKEIISSFSRLAESLHEVITSKNNLKSSALILNSLIDNINSCADQLESKLKNGIIELKGPNCKDITGKCYDLVSSSVMAISYPTADFWNSENGKEFFKRNKKALEKKVRIDRIFILDNLTADNINDFLLTMESHVKFSAQYGDLYTIYITSKKKYRESHINSSINNYRYLTDFNSETDDKQSYNTVPDVSFFDGTIVSTWKIGITDKDIKESRIIEQPALSRAINEMFIELKNSSIPVDDVGVARKEIKSYL